MPGRHGKGAEIVFDSRYMSAYLDSVSKSVSVEPADITSYGSTADSKQFLMGLNDGVLRCEGLFHATGGDANIAVMFAGAHRAVCVYPIGWNAIGDPVWQIFGPLISWETTTPVADMVSLTCEWQADGGITLGVALHAHALGGVLASGPNTAYDSGAASTRGGVGLLNCWSNTRNSTSVVAIQDSPDNSVWTDLIVFDTLIVGAGIGRQVEVTGTVNRYLRANYTLTAGTGALALAVSFARR